MRLRMLKGGDPARYNVEMCQRIQAVTQRLTLPKLTREEMGDLKEHLAEYTPIKSEELRYKFLNLRNCFLIVSEFETKQENLDKIRPILDFLDGYKYVFDLIIESQSMREHPALEKALIVLHLDISKFCMRYAYMLTETDLHALDFSPSGVPKLDSDDVESTPADDEHDDDALEPTADEAKDDRLDDEPGDEQNYEEG